MPDPQQTEERTIYVCPRCGTYRTPEGVEEKYGPPECTHGPMFGSDPNGGGESEMEAVQVVPASRLASLEAEVERLRVALTGCVDALGRMPDAMLHWDDPRYAWWHNVAGPALKNGRSALSHPSQEENE